MIMINILFRRYLANCDGINFLFVAFNCAKDFKHGHFVSGLDIAVNIKGTHGMMLNIKYLAPMPIVAIVAKHDRHMTKLYMHREILHMLRAVA